MDYIANMPTLQILTSIAAVSLGYVLYWASHYGQRAPNMPPGPPTLPVIGNANIMPRERLHLKFTEWSKVYGDVFSLKVFNQTIIVLNSPTIVKEVIDIRSASSSNRPKSILADMITPHNMNMGTGHLANTTWKSMRKATAQLLNAESIRRLGYFQKAESCQLMWELAHMPENWYSHLRRYTTSYALGIIYGKRGPTLSSPDVVDFMDVHPKFINALEIGTMPPVDLFPILTLVPERWANWKKIVKNIRHLHETLYDRLLSTVEKRMANGNGTGVFLEQMITKAQQYGLTTRDHILHTGGVLLEGSDTCSASMQNAVYCLINFPHVLKKAQEEIDRVVGKERAPDWADLPNLPYVLAFIEEVHRYRPIGPMGLPHSMVEDEVINGVLYPKDSVIFINLWAMFHDERYFDRPEEFLPERFLKHPFGVRPDVEDDPARRPNMLFGGGRRVCPGLAFAKTSLEINIANMIWGFDFAPAKDPVNGKEIRPSLDDHTTGVTATPKEYPVRITPRSAQHKDIIDKEFASAAGILSQFELEISDEDKVFNDTYRDSL
ncbi:hypothetical protein K443DRAFT_678870 [Laccaria amethystina LaAM-08-1]|jgi:cytochrome P450|uniref:Cytochrome P450 n=1 Tax=Laccaria amethystina LaAM-08-1 TaxID=1095629 RepID=A0A0C9X709_9AGAR|nr:hypothetical protein K443DRAFT_678870 [Laccaria amethystina LaAM-08-1]